MLTLTDEDKEREHIERFDLPYANGWSPGTTGLVTTFIWPDGPFFYEGRLLYKSLVPGRAVFRTGSAVVDGERRAWWHFERFDPPRTSGRN